MGEPKKAKDTWAHQFTDSSYVAYTTILEPRGARAQRHDKVSVQAVDYDDVMTSVGDDFRRMRVAVGDYVLMYNDDMEDVPYAAVVRGIELLPKSRWPAIDAASGGDPSERLRAAGGADAAWLARQEAEGRLPAKYFVLRVQYFYRYHELMGALGTRGDCNQQERGVEKSLERLGLRPPAGRVGARAGGAALEQVARYLVYSNHVSTGDERNPHVPLASVVNTSR
ncbi:hypothetical protein Rsub_09531 [Raphidocelis subcapitata]|uniref:Uncharacterized protein n=1 Tax=Raphidocelis subcapitata TaxID=307507 RepID=A0A2V0PB23_9CHLO|nr:hypothetical protein Rsub_09531 [Raphidocelis subcapitata]|eukprot:GBF97058.1 hypothetical protein Rsub_09531 [Raphidocelis subcapitata]